ncbi:hypothetical protein BJX96DRAFT_179163 [Aspergillus floccosus]
MAFLIGDFCTHPAAAGPLAAAIADEPAAAESGLNVNLARKSRMLDQARTADGWVKGDAKFRVIAGTGDPDFYICAIGDIPAHADRLA